MTTAAPRRTASLRQGGKAPALPGGRTLGDLAREILSSDDPEGAASLAADLVVQTAADASIASERLVHLRQALRRGGAKAHIAEATKRASVTSAANAARADRIAPGPRPDPHYQIGAVQARLEAADTKREPSRQDAIDVMIALAARPAELKNLTIGEDGLVGGYAKARGAPPRPYAGLLSRERAAELLRWVQGAIRAGRLPDPGTPGSKPYRLMLQAHGLMPKHLRVLGAEYAARASGAATEAERMLVRRQALRHTKHRSPTEYYLTYQKPVEEMNTEEYLEWLLS
jgi:hypothetical protein